MSEEKSKLTLLEQREIEMKVLGPVIRAFAEEIGKERADGVVRKTIREIAEKQGAATSGKTGKGLENLAKCVSAWNEGGSLDTSMIEESGEKLRFDVTRCKYAEIYKKLGFEDIGTLVSCDRDAAFLKGFDPDLELTRHTTIMSGGKVCDFCYTRRKK